MFLTEPPYSGGDIHFNLFGVPVRIHPFFWIVTLLLGLRGGSTPPGEIVVWIVAVVLSMLVHEMGHAIAQRRYGGHPRIVLYGMGGLAICEDCDRSPTAQILISLAGPVAGFLFALVLVGLVRAAGHAVGLLLPGEMVLLTGNLTTPAAVQFPGFAVFWEAFPADPTNRILVDLLWINLLWGFINLLPIYPLDGGRISRELCLLGDPRRGMVLSLRISVVAAIGMALVGLTWQSFFVVLFFGFMAYSSYKTLEAYRANVW